MPLYSNPPPPGVAVVTVNLTYHNAPVGPGGTHSIRYVGVAGAAGTHHGYLDYSVGGGALSIHTMDATPQGVRLGSLLLFEAVGRATFNGVSRIAALNVAANARGFYLRARFHPGSGGRNIVEAIIPTPVAAPMGNPNFAARFALARTIANWEGTRADIQAASFAEIAGHWL